MKKSTLLTAWLLLGLVPGKLEAAVDGKLDASSRGDIEISLRLVPSLQIDTVKDINLNITDRSVDSRFSESFCVTGNAESRYTVTANGSGSDIDFVLENTDGEQLEYELSFRGDPGSNTWDGLTPGRSSPAYHAFNNKSECHDTAFQIIFRSQELQSADSGRYSGYLTLVVSPV